MMVSASDAELLEFEFKVADHGSGGGLDVLGVGFHLDLEFIKEALDAGYLA